jgi:hypothetical protein
VFAGYKFVGHYTDDTDVYVGWMTVRGAWIIVKYDLSSDSAATFAQGASDMPTRGAAWAAENYASLETTF